MGVLCATEEVYTMVLWTLVFLCRIITRNEEVYTQCNDMI